MKSFFREHSIRLLRSFDHEPWVAEIYDFPTKDHAMKNWFLYAFLVLLFVDAPLFSKPLFTKSRYLIATQDAGNTGTVGLGNTSYPIAFSPLRDETKALESDYWTIVPVDANTYAFQNVANGKYVKYNSQATSDRYALILTDALESDNSTSFTLELNSSAGYNYYVIRSVSNTSKVWDRRQSLYSGVYPVAVYSATGGMNQNFLIYDSNGNPVQDDGLTEVQLPSAKRNLGIFGNYFSSLNLNSQIPAVYQSKVQLAITLMPEQLNTALEIQVNFRLKNPSFSLYVNNEKVDSGNKIVLPPLSGDLVVPFVVKYGTLSVLSGKLSFTTLPIVQLFTDATPSTVYSLGRIIVTEPDKLERSEELLTNVRVRGGISAGFPKTSFAINLKAADGVSPLDKSFHGLRKDNNWILDAMYIDPGRMRNRVSTDLWNSFSTKPYWSNLEPGMRNGTRGHFVEVYINNSYNGLYCMTEKIDRKQLNIKRISYDATSGTPIQKGGLYKAVNWNIATLMGYGPYNGYKGISSYNNNYESWAGYECKYPELLDNGEPIDWKPLYDAVYASSYLNSDANFKTTLSDQYDLPVYLDYYLLIELMLASDNQGKNTYLSVYDQSQSRKISLTPWDMDGTWGRRWDGSTNVTYAKQNFDQFVINNEHGQSNLFLRLKSVDPDGWNRKVIDRYRELRGGAFAHDSLMARFAHYANIADKSGAGNREALRWSIFHPLQELSFLDDWINDRLDYLDLQYLGASYTALIQDNAPRIIMGPNPVQTQLYIGGLHPRDLVELYSLSGILLQSFRTYSDRMFIDFSVYPSGVYLVKTGDICRKIIK